LALKPEGKRPLSRPKSVWKDTVRLTEIGWEVMKQIHLAEDRKKWGGGVANRAINLGFHKMQGKFMPS
jgi:hypothetical protein